MFDWNGPKISALSLSRYSEMYKIDVKNIVLEEIYFFLLLNIYVTPLIYRAWRICRLQMLFFFWEALQLTNGPLCAFDIICDVPHSSLATYVEMGKKIQFAKSPQASSREPMNGRSLSVTGKKGQGKKIVTLFLPRRAKSRSFATRRRGMPECAPSYFVGGKYSFQNDYRLSFSFFFPIGDAREWWRDGTRLSRSPWEIIRANPPLRTRREEDLSSSINKHNCPRSWRGRNSSWINLRATAVSRLRRPRRRRFH